MSSKKFWTLLLTVAATLVLGVLALNFMPGEKQIERQLTRQYDTADPQFRRSLGVLLGPPIIEGNQVEALLNGDQIFPAMLEAIRGAKKTITLETYIYWSESIGTEFSEALAERARAGVKVHVMLDFMGSMKMDNAQVDKMKAAGVQVQRYHKPVWWKLARMNNRTHRKLLIIDGTVGFTGGVGIADQWRGNAQDEDHWRDSHFRVEGPVVGQMQAVFNDNWTKATGVVLDGPAYFPPLQPKGTMPAQMFSSSPTGGSESMHLMYLMAITSARETIDLSASYFVPDELTVRTLIAAAKRGVKVRLITPGHIIDSDLVRAASRDRWPELLAAGVQISEYQPTMYHVKTLIVDKLLVSVGSTNFDNRSFSINDEANLNVLDAGFATQMTDVFDADWKLAKPVTPQALAKRPWWEHVSTWFASLFEAQL
ncbi:phosphatidylserine/phosphatidylglycerophosphate/cardiolipin synthase family protein [Massilia aurea]|jgi:cardiolipin synthase|uniref:phospholipase D-like domain-containing protein n=1 Tax=Massilia aurea TaxID=373040 RepID=UPI002162E5DA|nr:phospholipase D-like domain-containing protein [Massilia aurea]MCS0707522.1 phospholipase D-like domain-containing protein [Massilia aurea]